MTDKAQELRQRGYTDAFYGKDHSELYNGIMRQVYQQGREDFYTELEEADKEALIQFTQLAKQDIANGDVSSVQSLRDKLAQRREELEGE